MSHFKIVKKLKNTGARAGILKTAHGVIKTPFFMPVATQGAVKLVTNNELKALGAQIILANTYHLMLRPGEKKIKKLGGLRGFSGWQKPILSDSGGFQIFSLAGHKRKNNNNLVKLSGRGVKFKSYIDGRDYYLTPEKALKIQADLGVDIAVCLDECVALPATRAYLERSVELTTAWAKRSKNHLNKMAKNKPLLFCVIQGGLNKKLRLKSLADLAAIGFDGYNIGGLSVGESPREMYQALSYLLPAMPEDKPRYLMGVGYPEQIVRAVKLGVDMFDCVIPTREGRHGRLFLWDKKRISNFQFLPQKRDPARAVAISNKNSKSNTKNKKFYNCINITNSKFAGDRTPINADSCLPELRQYSRAYLNYLFKINEPLAKRLATLNNLEFYLDLMKKIRQAINQGKF